MRLSKKFVLFCSLLPALFVATLSPGADTQGTRSAHFSYDKNIQGTDYYYDRDNVEYLSDNRVSTWLRITSPDGEDFIRTEIECSGSMFRTVQPYKPLIFKADKLSYAAYGWLPIPPDSEIHLLRKILCKQ